MDEPQSPRFFTRGDPTPDPLFYSWPRFVTHIDDDAIAAVGALYDELGIGGDVLDLMSSWVSHFRERPDRLTILGMNAEELAANPQASAMVVHDLNDDPSLPFDDESFDAAVCCVSVDYLVHPIAVFREVARVVRPGGLFACTFSNRCFPTKADRRLAVRQRRATVRDRGRLLPPGGWVARADGRPAHAGPPFRRPALRGLVDAFDDSLIRVNSRACPCVFHCSNSLEIGDDGAQDDFGNVRCGQYRPTRCVWRQRRHDHDTGRDRRWRRLARQ